MASNSFQKDTRKLLRRARKAGFIGTNEKPVFVSQAAVWFDESRIEKPALLTFNTVLLHPGSFINVDVRKVDFTDMK